MVGHQQYTKKKNEGVLPKKWNIGLFMPFDAIITSIKGAVKISVALEHDKLLHSVFLEQWF